MAQQGRTRPAQPGSPPPSARGPVADVAAAPTGSQLQVAREDPDDLFADEIQQAHELWDAQLTEAKERAVVAKQEEVTKVEEWRAQALAAKAEEASELLKWKLTAVATKERDARDMAKLSTMFPDYCPKMLYFRHLRGKLGCTDGDDRGCPRGLYAIPPDFHSKVDVLEWPGGVDVTGALQSQASQESDRARSLRVEADRAKATAAEARGKAEALAAQSGAGVGIN